MVGVAGVGLWYLTHTQALGRVTAVIDGIAHGQIEHDGKVLSKAKWNARTGKVWGTNDRKRALYMRAPVGTGGEDVGRCEGGDVECDGPQDVSGDSGRD